MQSRIRAAAPGSRGGVPELGNTETAAAFNDAAKQFFAGKSFLELDDPQKEQYLELILDAADRRRQAAGRPSRPFTAPRDSASWTPITRNIRARTQTKPSG